MKITDKLSFATKVIHAGVEPDPTTGAIMTPIYNSSTFAQEYPTKHKGFEYSRSQNPTRKVLEENLAALENAQYGFCFSSGCAAATVLMLGLNPNDHVLALDDLYGGTRRLFQKVFQKFGIEFSFRDMSEPNSVRDAIQSNTKMIWIESPSNPLLKLVDIREIASLAKEKNILLCVDNTFATPALQTPLTLGADFVLHSTTKYIGGHSDVVGGAILTNNKEWAETIAFISNSTGAVPAPTDCFMILRGIKTLDIRMQRHCENALFIAQKLFEHENVEKVYFPGLESHPQFKLAREQMKGTSGIVSFELKGNLRQTMDFCQKTQLFICAESLGGVESLIEHPASMTHASVVPSTRIKIGIKDNLIRLSVGIEDKCDLWSDLQQALESL